MSFTAEDHAPLGLYNFGVSYLEVARAAAPVSKTLLFDDPIEFLVAHGLELIFKADACRGTSLARVRKRFGHDLAKLYRSLSPEFLDHFRLPDGFDELVSYLAIGHSGPNWRNRYLETGIRQQVPIERVLSYVTGFDLSNRRWLSRHFVRATNELQ